MTIIYEVRLKIESHLKDDFSSWLPDHINEMLQLPGFISAKLYEEAECGDIQKEYDFVVQYELESKKTLLQYFDQYAPRMREEGLKRFGDCFIASRKVMTQI